MEGLILTEQLMADFRYYLQCEEKSKNTIEKYMRDVCRFADYTEGVRITKENVIDYKKKLLEKNYAIRSINSMLASLNGLFSFCERMDLKAKMMKVQQQIYCPKDKELTKEEYLRLVKVAQGNGNERLNMLIQTICGTGIRVSELQYITVEAVRRGETMVSSKGKTRSVFIVRKLQKRLLTYVKSKQISSGAIFVTKSGKVMSRANIWREMKNLCEQARVNPKKVFPHNFRHLFARTFYNIEKAPLATEYYCRKGACILQYIYLIFVPLPAL